MDGGAILAASALAGGGPGTRQPSCSVCSLSFPRLPLRPLPLPAAAVVDIAAVSAVAFIAIAAANSFKGKVEAVNLVGMLMALLVAEV